MLRIRSASDWLDDHVHELQQHLPGVYDGGEEAIHDVRVALRRTSEALSAARDEYDEHALAAIQTRVTKAARALGRVRDADSGQRLVQDVEQRFPFAAATLGQLRAVFSDEQYRSRRKAIKKLEALELNQLPIELAGAWQGSGHRWPLRSHTWTSVVLRHIAARAADARAAIEHATGVYFPNRAHSARMAIKQLRYALELSIGIGISRPRRHVRLLKKAQETLGAAHDRDVLLEHLEALQQRRADVINVNEADALCRFLRAETLALHRRYLAWRPELYAICDTCLTAAHRGRAAIRAVVIAGIGVPTVLLLSRNSASAQTG